MMQNKTWLDDERKVFLSRFTGSSMGNYADKYTGSHDFWRIKTYTKEHDMMVHPRLRDFEEPYQVAQKFCGGTWNEYNAPFAIQVGACNIDCYFCFVAKELKDCNYGAYFTAAEIVAIFSREMKRGVFRISGGEPFLAPEFIKDVAFQLSSLPGRERFLWVDTNLLGTGYDDVTGYLNSLSCRVPFGICGCFKGFDASDFSFNTGSNRPGSMLDTQFKNARTMVARARQGGEIFFYIPEITESITVEEARDKIASFISRLRKEVHENAPLRVTVLKIKTYPTNKDRMRDETFPSGKTRELWLEAIKEVHGVERAWLPQNQASLRDDDCDKERCTGWQ